MTMTVLFVLQTSMCEHLSRHQHYITIVVCLSVHLFDCRSVSVCLSFHVDFVLVLMILIFCQHRERCVLLEV